MKRNYGIDLLRMILMFMVVILHVLGKGGVLDAVNFDSANYYIVWCLECLCYCAVNCYALITGYVYYGTKYKASSFMSIWVQTIFYSVGISAIFWTVSRSTFSFGSFLDAFFPVSRITYWYVSAYAGLFILIPLLNLAVRSISMVNAKRFLLVGIVFFTVLPTFLFEDPFTLKDGYSPIWLAFLYLVGAFVHKFNWEAIMTKKRSLMIFIVCGMSSALFKFLVEHIPQMRYFDTNISKILISYVSPTTFFAAVALFLVFLQLNLHPTACKILKRYSPAAFGVYLIHCQPYIFDSLMYRFTCLAEVHPLILVPSVICVSLCIYLPCLLIDYLRICLFKKLHINDWLKRFSSKLALEEAG